MFVYELPTLRMLAVNEAALRCYGFTMEEFLQLNVCDLHPADERPRLTQAILNRASGPAASGPWRLRRKDGTEIVVEVSSLELTWEGRNARCASLSDITERRRAEEAMQKRMVALTNPADVTASVDFDDLFNRDDIQKLQDQFARATGVAAVITRPDGTPITRPSNFTPLCADIIRQTELGRCNCFKSDAALGRPDATGPIVRPCLSGGLWDAGASIVVGGRHIANWLVGQVRDETQDEAPLRAYARAIGADETAFIAAYRRVPAMTRERFEAIAQTVFTLARQLSSAAYQNIQQARSIAARNLAEDALRAREEQFRATIEHAGAGYFRVDREGRFEAVNRAWLRMHGRLSAQEILGQPFQTTLVEKDREAGERNLQRSLAGWELPNGEATRRLADGSTACHSFSLHPVRRDGEVVAVEGFIIDTTSLRRAVSDYKMLFDTMLDGFSLYDVVCDHAGRPVDFRYLTVNPAYERQTGLKAEAVLGRTLLEVMPTIEPSRIDAYGQVALTGEPRMLVSYNRTLQRHLSISAFRPAPGQLACMVIDITARKRASAQIREQAALLDVTHDAIFVARMDRTVTYWNRRAAVMFGLPPDAAGQKIETLTYQEPPADFPGSWKTIVEQHDWNGERRWTTPTGHPLDIRIRTRVFSPSGGEDASVLVVITDITESKRLEAQFLRAQRLESLGALASGVAHDLNNVLTPILMAAELLRPLAQAQDDLETLRLLSDSARRGSDIVRQLLLFGRGSDSPRSALNLGGVIQDVGRMMHGTFPKNIVLSIQAPADLRLVDADRTQIHQVVLNLCVNARDAMPQGGRLAVVADNVEVDEAFARSHGGKRTGGHVRLQVRDTGTGIAPEHLDKIFDPFFTTKPVGQGTGLGLSISYRIVRDHGGQIRVASEPGRGTRFLVSLPLPAAIMKRSA